MRSAVYVLIAIPLQRNMGEHEGIEMEWGGVPQILTDTWVYVVRKQILQTNFMPKAKDESVISKACGPKACGRVFKLSSGQFPS